MSADGITPRSLDMCTSCSTFIVITTVPHSPVLLRVDVILSEGADIVP